MPRASISKLDRPQDVGQCLGRLPFEFNSITCMLLQVLVSSREADVRPRRRELLTKSFTGFLAVTMFMLSSFDVHSGA